MGRYNTGCRRSDIANASACACALAVFVVILSACGRADAEEFEMNTMPYTSTRQPTSENGITGEVGSLSSVSRSTGASGPVASVSRSSVTNASDPPAFAVAAAERFETPERCEPGNCVATFDELSAALEDIEANGGGVGTVTVCRGAPLVLTSFIQLVAPTFVDITIECCDTRVRRRSSSVPACTIVQAPTCDEGSSTSCDFNFFGLSVTLRGIAFEGNGEESFVGIVDFSDNFPETDADITLDVIDCVFENSFGSLFEGAGGNFVRARALTIFAESFFFSLEPQSGTQTVRLVRTGFFDNVLGGVGVFAGASQKIAVSVIDCQFERNGESVFRIFNNDNSGIAVLGRVDSVTIESSRFEDNLSAKRGAAIQIDSTVLGAAVFPGFTSVTIEDNVFKNNTCGPNLQGERTNGGAVFISLNTVDSSVSIADSLFVDNTAFGGTVAPLFSEGGALYVQEVFGDLSIDKCRFRRNVADDAAAIFLRNIESVSLTRSKIERNDSLESRAAVRYGNQIGLGSSFSQGSLLVLRCTFKRNIGSALEIIDSEARIERSKFVRNTQVGLPLVNNVINPVYGGGAIVYNGVLSALDGTPLPPLVVADSSFIKNEAFGPGGAIIIYQDEELFLDLEGRVRFIRNVSQQGPAFNDVAVVEASAIDEALTGWLTTDLLIWLGGSDSVIPWTFA